MGNELIPFGKYKGQPVEVLAQDREYCDWLLTQDWFRTRFTAIQTLIVNNFGEVNETPEHNALQALFTDNAWVVAFATYIYGERLSSEFKERKRDAIARRDSDLRRLKEELKHQDENIEFYSRPEYNGSGRWKEASIAARQELLEKIEVTTKSRQFIEGLITPEVKVDQVDYEVEGADVVVEPSLAHFSDLGTLRIECKPIVGDDYPAILRQMKVSKCKILLIGEGGYCGVGATLEQVKQIFRSAKIRIVFASEIQVSG